MPFILTDFRRIACAYPSRTALAQCHTKGRAAIITFAELDRRSDELAAYLAARGIGRGKFVGIYMMRSIDHVAAILGILKTGAAFYSLNIRSTVAQLAYTASLSAAPFILVDGAALLNLQSARVNEISACSFIFYSGEGLTPIDEELLSSLEKTICIDSYSVADRMQYSFTVTEELGPDDVALALFTSGSTGNPKGVLVSHQDLYNRTRRECEYYELSHDDILLSVLPFSFDVGANQLFTGLVTGAQLILLNSWMPADIVSTIKQHHVSGISAVPAIWAAFLNLSNGEEALQDVNAVRYITISGGDLSPQQLKRLAALLQGTRIFKTYGQTETFRSAILLPAEYQEKMLSVGRPVKGTRVLIMKSQGKLARPNEVGEILHYGDGTMAGYLGDPKGTSQKVRSSPFQDRQNPLPERAVFTGDIGRMDEDGYLYVLGRKDKMIKSSGYRVYPKEVSDRLLLHKSVQEAVVFGVRHRDIGEAIYAEVQLKPKVSLTEDDLKRFVSMKLPPYMIPARIVFVDSIPRTSSGKIRLSEVEARYDEKK